MIHRPGEHSKYWFFRHSIFPGLTSFGIPGEVLRRTTVPWPFTTAFTAGCLGSKCFFDREDGWNSKSGRTRSALIGQGFTACPFNWTVSSFYDWVAAWEEEMKRIQESFFLFSFLMLSILVIDLIIRFSCFLLLFMEHFTVCESVRYFLVLLYFSYVWFIFGCISLNNFLIIPKYFTKNSYWIIIKSVINCHYGMKKC